MRASEWQIGEHATHFDPLLDCVAEVTRLHGHPLTREALSAGLPLVDNLLTPSLVPRAAARAHLTARVVRQPLERVSAPLLPAILLLQGHGACVLLGWNDDGTARVRVPEAGESGEVWTREALAERYAGIVIYLRPRFRFDQRAPALGKVRSRHWFWGAVGESWRLYRDALFAALLVNLFALAFPLFSMNVYDRVVPNHALETLWVLAVGASLVLLFDFGLRTARGHIVDVANQRIDVTLSALIMERVMGIRMEARPPSVGSFAANLRSFDAIRDFIASASVTTLVDLPFVLLFLLALLWIHPLLTLPPLIGMVLVVGLALVVQQRMHELAETTHRASAQRNATLVEGLVGIETIKALGAEGTVQRRWERATQFLSQVGGRSRLLSSTSVNLASLIQQLVSVSMLVVGVYLLTDASISMGGLIAATMLSGRALAPLGQLVGLLMQYQTAHSSLSSLEHYMQLPVERSPDAQFLHRPQFRGEIEFKEVSFSYPGREVPALRRVSFRIQAGERVAVIGRLGSGKTTLERLILGLYQPTEGSVRIDGVDARQIDPAELRRAIGFVPQDPLLFFDTLRNNIALGAPFADDRSILAAAELAGVTEFANAHPSGFDMMVGERGESLSGGQRQAVAVARAVLNDPPMLLFDEPSNAMDHTSEERLKARLREYVPGKTLILVTHRTALLDLVDRLIVLDNGLVVADGPKAHVVEALQQGRIGRA